MVARINQQLVFTVKDRCRVCYTCVRECPVKAIRIANGQAEVMKERCIGCGNCVKVCSQGAKVFIESIELVNELLRSPLPTAVCIAPSFPAEFKDIDDYRKLVGMLKKLGFNYVLEVAFGADLVAKQYEAMLKDKEENYSISSDCPAIAYYVRHYYPHLTNKLAPIVSPMIATARVARQLYGGDELRVVFVGPCVAKKAESFEIDAVLTFRELRKMFADRQISANDVQPCDFDEPKGGRGSIFPVTRGKLHTIELTDSIGDNNIISASGRVNFRDAIREFDEGLCNSVHLELLCCEGCIMGPGMSEQGNRFHKTKHIREYVRKKMAEFDKQQWEKAMNAFKNIDLSRHFEPCDRRIPTPENELIRETLIKMGKNSPYDHLNCGACGYDTCYEHAVAIVEGLAESEMCLPYTIEKLHNIVQELNISNQQLASAQQSLRQTEKLATMGQLSAGIAHELNNPLGVITMYSNILLEELPANSPFRKDLELIVEQADRCKKIVGGLLNFARKNQVHLTETDIVAFSQHSLESIIIPDNIKVEFSANLADKYAYIDNDQWMQVLTNIEKNAIEAMPEGGTLKVEINGNDQQVEFKISDTGCGISDENLEKIFTPFFTTKKPGKGTGLGLPLIYGIVKMHKGQIGFTTNADKSKGPTGTTFTITIPRNPNQH